MFVASTDDSRYTTERNSSVDFPDPGIALTRGDSTEIEPPICKAVDGFVGKVKVKAPNPTNPTMAYGE